MGKGKGVSQDDVARAMIAHNDALMGNNRYGYGLGTGIKEDFNNSRFGRNVNKFVKKHKNVIDAVRNDESVQNLYHSKRLAPYHKDIDAVVNRFGGGLYAGSSRMGGGIHHHLHYHMAGEGIFDFLDPKKNGLSNKISNVGKTIRDKMEQRGFNNQGALLKCGEEGRPLCYSYLLAGWPCLDSDGRINGRESRFSFGVICRR